jgi:hypothetical protein
MQVALGISTTHQRLLQWQKEQGHNTQRFMEREPQSDPARPEQSAHRDGVDGCTLLREPNS